MKAKTANFWTQLETKKISKSEITQYLSQKLGTPANQTQSNLLQELCKKIHSYYFQEEPTNYSVYSLTGTILKTSDIIEKKFKEGKRIGQTYYVLKVSTPEGEEKLQARQEDMSAEKWNQITKLALINKNLVFKYKKYITNKQIIDYYPSKRNKQKESPSKAEGLENQKRFDKA